MKKLVKQLVHGYQYYPDMDVPIEEFINELRGYLEKIPDEYVDSANLLFHARMGDYDEGPELEFEVYYTRKESDLEYNRRMSRESDDAWNKERQERRELKRLLEKYGDSSEK